VVIVTSNESWQRFLDTGAVVGQVTLAKANDIARGLMADEPSDRQRAWQELDDLSRIGRQMGEQLADLARDQLGGTLRGLSSVDDLLDLIDGLLGSYGRTEEGTEADQTPEPLRLRIEPTGPLTEAETAEPKAKKAKKGTKASKSGPSASGGSGNKKAKQRAKKSSA
jgi:hypothetical protein